MSTKPNRVDEALKLPGATEFLNTLTELLDSEEPVAITSLDVDNFLNVNTKYGRDEGDKVLIALGNTLREGLPDGTKLYRYGGDQFTVIFPSDCDKENAFLAMERLRGDCVYIAPDGDKITISVGVAAAPEDGSRYYELLRKAEGAMIRAKLNGRDRVCLAREEKMVVKTTHYTQDQLQRLSKLAKREGTGEAILLREALDALLKKYDV